MENLPCLHSSGVATEATITTLTAKPFEDNKNFAIGALIQDPALLIRPNDEAIKEVFANRTRCALVLSSSLSGLIIWPKVAPHSTRMERLHIQPRLMDVILQRVIITWP